MGDLINRQNLLELIDWYDHQYSEIESYLDIIRQDIKSLSSAESEIIRCKDCKWCSEHYDTDGNAPYWICRNWDGGTDADGFCYEAERITDE